MLRKIAACCLLLSCMGCHSQSNVVYTISTSSVPLSTQQANSSLETEQIMKDKVILCIGDSITEGDAGSSYPTTLTTLLPDYDVVNLGVAGSTASYDSLTNYQETVAFKDSLTYDNVSIILFLFGTNDSNTTTWQDEATFKEQYLQLVSIYQQTYPDAQLILMTPPDCFDLYDDGSDIANFGIQLTPLSTIRECIKDIADELQLDIIDIYEYTKEKQDWFYGDGVHPNEVGSKMIAHYIYDYLQTTIS